MKSNAGKVRKLLENIPALNKCIASAKDGSGNSGTALLGLSFPGKDGESDTLAFSICLPIIISRGILMNDTTSYHLEGSDRGVGGD